MDNKKTLVDFIAEDLPKLGKPKIKSNRMSVKDFVTKTKLEPVVVAYKSISFENVSVGLEKDYFVISGQSGGLKKTLCVDTRGILSSVLPLHPDIIFDTVMNVWLKEEEPFFDYFDIPTMIIDANAGDAATDNDAVKNAFKAFCEGLRLEEELCDKIMSVRLSEDDEHTAKTVTADFFYERLGVTMSVSADVRQTGRDALAKYATLVLAAGYNDFLLTSEVKANLCIKTLEDDESNCKVAGIMTNGEGFAAAVERDSTAAVVFIPETGLSGAQFKSEIKKALDTILFASQGAAPLLFLYALMTSSTPDEDFIADAENFAMQEDNKVIWGVREFLSNHLSGNQ